MHAGMMLAAIFAAVDRVLERYMATIRDQILDAVVTALNTGAPAGVPAAQRKRFLPLEGTGDLPFIDVAPGEESKQAAGSNRHSATAVRTLKFKVRVWAAGGAPEVVSDPMVAWVTRALEGNRLGGLAQYLEEQSTSWQDYTADQVYGCVEIEFAAQYQTRMNDQEAT